MKRFLSLIFTFLILSTAAVFADEPGDDYDDGYEYDQNGAGDQFIKFDIAVSIPLYGSDDSSLFHKDQLHVGFAFDLGYYKFLTPDLAVGGEIAFTSNWSIGDKLLTIIPFTGGVLYQPSIGKFEFPLIFNVGLAYESWANFKYFPSPAIKASAGAYYRITESWSAGLSANYLWIPQWAEGHDAMNGMLTIINIGGRFHF